MSNLSLAQLQALAASVGFPDPALAAAVAEAESGGNPNAYGDAKYGGSIGLWQVNLPSHPQYTAAQLYDPTFNAQAALTISNNGTNWQPWTTYRTGAYKRWYNTPTPSSPLAPNNRALVAAAVVSVAAAGIALAWDAGLFKHVDLIKRWST